MRIDLYLCENKFANSRTKAKSLIEKNLVYYRGKLVNKPSFDVCTDEVEVKEHTEYVGRGAYKLLKAFDVFDIGKHDLCLDIGSSTGGFTQVLLKNGAKEVYAIDVGVNQMVDELRYDKRVHLYENTNFRNISVDDYPKFDLIVCDVSFISLKMIIPNSVKMLKNNGEMIFLIKPQFELKSKNHIINNKKKHLSIINDINSYLNSEGIYISDMTYSPIKGKSGNIEYLIHITTLDNKNIKFKDVVETAFNKLR